MDSLNRVGLKRASLVFVTLAALASCGQREVILEGERLDIRPGSAVAEQEADQAAAVARLALPAAVVNPEWTHKNGTAKHRISHPGLSPGLTHAWSQPIGRGNNKKLQISSDPIIAGGRVFTLDAKGEARAFSTSGSLIWSRNLTPGFDKEGQASGGGLAYGDGTLFATTGYGEVISIDPAKGTIRWRHRMDATISAPPVYTDGVVVAVGRNNVAMGLDARNGRIKWQQQSSSGEPGLFGASAPAASGKLVVLPFSSGEIVGVLARNGLRAWSTAVSGGRRGIARNNVGDISGDPVVDGDTIYLGNQSGRMVAIDRRSGERKWTAREGAYGPVWPEAGSVFVVTDQSKLKRLDATNGVEIWSVDLPLFKRPKKRANPYAHFGPVLAGGRLFVASSDGGLRVFIPETGAAVAKVDISGGAASQPAVAGGVLYVLSKNGQLHAFQ